MIEESEKRLRSEQKDAELRLNATCTRIEGKLDNHISDTKNMSERSEDKFERFDGKLDGFRKEMDGFKEGVNKRFDDSRRWSVGIIVTVVVGFASVIVAMIVV